MDSKLKLQTNDNKQLEILLFGHNDNKRGQTSTINDNVMDNDWQRNWQWMTMSLTINDNVIINKWQCHLQWMTMSLTMHDSVTDYHLQSNWRQKAPDDVYFCCYMHTYTT